MTARSWGVAAAAISGLGSASAAAQDAVDPAERDLDQLQTWASDAWGWISESATPYLDQVTPETAVVLAAAALGGFFGAGVRRGRQRGTALASVPVAPRQAPALSASSAGGFGVGGGVAFGGPGGRGQDADRLFAFFRERFGEETATADGAIDYLQRLAASIETLKRRAAESEKKAKQARGSADDAISEAPWEAMGEGGRLIRSSGHALRADPDYMDLVQEVGLEGAIQQLAHLRALKTKRDEGISADLIEEAWPHALLRAEALAHAYYPTQRQWSDFRAGLTLACAGLRTLLRRERVKVDYVRLLSPMSPGEGEMWSDSAEGLRDLEPVRRTVLANAGGGVDGFVVDCESFGFVDERRDAPVRSKLIVFNRAEWR